MGRISLPSAAGLSDEELTALATDAELAAAVANKVTAAQVPVKLNGTSDAVIPQDNGDSWIVGSDRMVHDPDASGAKNSRTFFHKVKAAFRAGHVTSTQWDVMGDYSAAFGLNSQAGGASAFAAGNSVNASGAQSHAEGQSTTASGPNSHAEGQGTAASGTRSHAEGLSTTASGSPSHAEGSGTTASGSPSHAQGSSTTASGANSFAGGATSTASGNNAFAFGQTCQATSFASEARGHMSVASRYAQRSFASGTFTGAGDSQRGEMVLRGLTTDATTGTLFAGDSVTPVLTASASSGPNVLTLTASRAFKLKVNVVARRTDVQGEMAGFTWEGLVGRDSTGSARIIGTPVEAAWGDTPATDAWALAVSIDTTDATNNYVKVSATGEAAKTVRWVAHLDWVEVAS